VKNEMLKEDDRTDTDSLNRSSGKHAFKLYVYFRYIFGVCKK
jgi:hypothetical protein